MEILKQTMQDAVRHLQEISEKIHLQIFLSEQDFLGTLGILDQLRREQKRCVEELSTKIGKDVTDCSTLAQLEQHLEAYQNQCQRRIREEKVLALAERFARIVGEADYGFALEPHQKALAAKSTEELLQMEEAGKLDSYRQLLELLQNSQLNALQVEPIAKEFGFHVAFGLLGGKYSCMQADEESAEAAPVPEEPAAEPDAVPEPEVAEQMSAEVPAEESAPEEQPAEEVPAEKPLAEKDAQDTAAQKPLWEQPPEKETEPVFPLTEVAAMIVEGSAKKPKGESSFFSTWRKSGPELGAVFGGIAYLIVDDWGLKKSTLHQAFQLDHSKQIIERATAMLLKEGFIKSYRLEGESAEDPFYYVSKIGYQILEKEALQRKVRGTVDKFCRPDITHAGVLVRLRRINELKEIFCEVEDVPVTRTIEGGFCGVEMFPEQDDRLCHFPLLYTREDTLENIRKFLKCHQDGRSFNERTKILLEVPEGQQAFWKAFFAAELSATAQYYVSIWNKDRYEDDSGNEWSLRELIGSCLPVTQKFEKAEKPETAEATEEPERECREQPEPEHVSGNMDAEEVPAEPEQEPEEEPVETEIPQIPEPLQQDPAVCEVPEKALPEEAPAVLTEPACPAAQEPISLEEQSPLTGAEASAKALADRLLQLPEPAENPDMLMELLYRLVAEGQTMEALVLAKTLTGVSKDNRFQKISRDLLHGSNLPLQEREYGAYVIQEDAGEDIFGRYSLVSAAFWAACFPKMAYDYNLYYNISGVVEPQMADQLPEELVSVRNAMSLLTNELKELSFQQGDGAGLSAGILDSLASGAVLEIKRKKLMATARDKLAAPRSTLSLPGFETVMKNIMGPAGEMGPSLLAVAEDRTDAYDAVARMFGQFVDGDGNISDSKMSDYIDAKWDALRKADPTITTKYLKAPARPTLQREITRRLEIMDEWLKRNAPNRGGRDNSNREAFRALVGKLQKYIKNACDAIDPLLAVTEDVAENAGLCLLKQSLERIFEIISGGVEIVQEPKKVFAGLLTTGYPILDSNGDPVLEELLNELPGMEPWRLMLKHIAAEKDTLEEALQQIEDYELHSSRYEDFGSAAIIRSVLNLPQEDRTMDDHYARTGCLDQEEAFMGDVRLACAYGQLAEEDKETIFAQLAQYRNLFVPDREGGAESREENQVCGNYAHYRMMLECLKRKVNDAKEQRRNQFWQSYEERAQYYPRTQLPSMLDKVRQELENDNLATAEEYLTRFDAGEVELPQESVYAAAFNFHDQYLSCADWYCAQCERPEHKNKGPKDWGRRVLQSKNFWSASNERTSAESILENWPNRKGDSKNPVMLRMFLRQIGLPVQQVFADEHHPSTNQYEVFVATMEPVESGREDYSHPVAKFGTLQEKTMYIVCLYGCKGAATLIDIMTKKLQLGGNTIVVMDGVVNVLERRRVAAQFKTMTSGQNAFLLIDRVLMLYLAAQDSGNRLNAMLQCTMPYIYEQLYTEGAGAVADEMFMGRIAERKSLCDPNGTCLVYGGRQLGKTALLRRVESINNKPNEQRYAVYLDIKERGSEYFIRELREKLLSICPDRPLLQGDETDLSQICSSLQRSSGLYRQLTVLIDEVDVYFEEIAHNNYNDIHPVVLLQDELKGKVKFVFAGTHNVAATAKAIEDNADIIKLRQPLCIRPLSSADAIQLIRWPLSYLGFEIGEQQIAMILANTNSYPGLIHLFCNSLVKSICENYSKYYDAGRGNPPYTVSDEQLRTIFREKDIKREIARRVIATIKVNPKYRVVTSLIAFLEYQDQENGTTRLYGYTPEEVQNCNAREFAIADFMPERIGLSDLDALMEEMEKMGILWKNQKTGSYRFRQRDFLGYIGTYNQVLTMLLEEV